MANTQTPADDEARRVIKRYSNRKLYDTTDSRYVTLQQIGEMVRRGEDVQIIDNKTKEDKTEITLALILSEDLKNKPRSVPLGTLRTLIQERGNKVLSTLREGPFGRLMPEKEGEEGEGGIDAAAAAVDAAVQEVEAASEARGEGGTAAAEGTESEDGPRKRLASLLESYRQGVDQIQHDLDERVKTVERALNPLKELREEVRGLSERIAAIEEHLGLGSDADRDKL